MENITKDFVPYNQSLELKELGFDEPCFALYEGKKLGFIFRTNDEPLVPIRFRCNSKFVENVLMNEDCTAPTFSQAFRWFRENYGVHMYPQKFDETKWWVNWGLWRSDIFDSFEEAELACLIKMIEILKIMKNNVKRK